MNIITVDGMEFEVTTENWAYLKTAENMLKTCKGELWAFPSAILREFCQKRSTFYSYYQDDSIDKVTLQTETNKLETEYRALDYEPLVILHLENGIFEDISLAKVQEIIKSLEDWRPADSRQPLPIDTTANPGDFINIDNTKELPIIPSGLPYDANYPLGVKPC